MEELKQVIEKINNCQDIDLLNDLRNNFFQSDTSRSQTLPSYLWDALNYAFGKRVFELFTGEKEVKGEVLGTVKSKSKTIILTKQSNLKPLLLKAKSINYAFISENGTTVRTKHGEFVVTETIDQIKQLIDNGFIENKYVDSIQNHKEVSK